MYSYIIEPTNFMLLDTNRRQGELNKWKSLLMSLKNPIKIVILREGETIDMGGKTITTQYHRFYIISRNDISHNFESFRFDYGYGEPNIPLPVEVQGRIIKLSDGRFASMLSVYSYPKEEAGLILHNVMQYADYILLYIEKLDTRSSRLKLDNFIKMLRADMMVKMADGVAAPLETQMTYNDAVETYKQMLSGSSAMHLTRMSMGVFADTKEELEKKMLSLVDVAEGSGLSVDRPIGGIQLMLYSNGGCEIYMSSDSLLHLYPFLSANLIEAPNGVAIGLNMTNGSPVVYNPDLRTNYNISIIGKSGSGKSMSIKIFLGRWMKLNRESPIFIIDPEGEYTYLSDFGFLVLDVREDVPINLDPVRLLPKGTALRLMRDMLGLNPREVSVLSVALKNSRDIRDLKRRVEGTSVEDYIRSMVEGPLGWLFSGSDLSLPHRTVFNLRLIDEDTREHVSALILGWIWNQMNEYPVEIKKMVVIDEAWLFRGEGAGEIIEHISRLGRKRNILLLIATQRIEDVVLHESHLKVTLQNSATKFIFRHDPSSLEALKALYIPQHLLERIVTDLNEGESLLITENTMAWAYWYPSEQEYMIYTTKPGEHLISDHG